MAKGGKTSAEDYLKDLKLFKGGSFSGWQDSARNLKASYTNVKGPLDTADGFQKKIDDYQVDKADKGSVANKTLKDWVSEIKGTLNKKMNKAHDEYSRKANLAQNATLQDCINDAKGQIEKLEKDLFPKSVSGKLGDFSPSRVNVGVTGASVGVTAMSFGVTGFELSFCGVCVLGSGTASSVTAADLTTHTAGSNLDAIINFMTGGFLGSELHEDATKTACIETGVIKSIASAARTHVGPYIKL